MSRPAPAHASPFSAVLVALLALSPGLAAQEGARSDVPADQEAHAARIEASLGPLIRVAGRPAEEHSLLERMAHYGVPGVGVAVIDGGEVVWAKGYGVKDVETGEPVTTGTLFQAASISKPVAAMAMLSLVEDGRLDLDADVNGYLESWRVPPYDFDEPVTLRRLASHTAGTTVHGFPGYARSAERPTTVGVLNGEGNTPAVVVDIEPGTEYRYSGGGVTIEQLVLEEVTGEPFPDFMRRTVLEPVGMASSTYEQPLPEDRWGDAASGHRADGTKVEEDWHVYPEMAAAGLWTTPTDLARLAVEVQRSLHGESNRVLSPETTAEMLTPVLDGYGLGFGTGSGPGARFGHGGANEGFRANLTATYEGGKGLAVMTNSDRGGVLAQEILLAVAREYGWVGVEPRTVELAELSPARRAALVGRYAIPAAGIELRIVAAEDGLFRLTRPGAPPATLAPVDGDRLVDLEDGTPLVVEWDGDRVARIRVQGLEIVPAGG